MKVASVRLEPPNLAPALSKNSTSPWSLTPILAVPGGTVIPPDSG